MFDLALPEHTIVHTMRKAFDNATRFYKFEFWGLTVLFAVLLIIFITQGISLSESQQLQKVFASSNTPYNYYRNFFWPQLARYVLMYFSFIAFSVLIIPMLRSRRTVWAGLLMLVSTMVLVVLSNYFTGTRLQAFQYNMHDGGLAEQTMLYDAIESSWEIVALYIVYLFLKWLGFYTVEIADRIEARYKFFRKESIVAVGVWIAGLLVLRFSRADTDFMVMWMLVISSAIGLYLISFNYLIPKAMAQPSGRFAWYALRYAVLLLLLFIVVYLLSLFFISGDNAGSDYSAFNAFFQLFVTMPLTWFLFKRFRSGDEQIWKLQTQLDQSTASIDLLRSQINPHFLFNALNTLYGTALQENANRTSEGIQRLGDMMRFMLKENTQDFISLSKEIEYLNNYISLQKLRTAGAKDIHVDVDIEEAGNDLPIAPMLLIPFVENAFKHGISTRMPSSVKIRMLIDDTRLHFEVTNTRHARHETDPERFNNGIGLNNVKQRLNLIYPGRHELLVRERPENFTVHLLLHLLKSK